jgi:hypothetical protein
VVVEVEVVARLLPLLRLRRLHRQQLLLLLAAVVVEGVAVVVAQRLLLAAELQPVAHKRPRNFRTTSPAGPCPCRWASK